ncbi:MAG: class B sortase, partial [Oscillospiraceae bacterium]|nr:class B sortase [Oscillospiraceae bacterium]
MSAQLFFIADNKSKINDKDIIYDLQTLKIPVEKSKAISINDVIKEISLALKTSQIIIVVGGTKVSKGANIRERIAKATSNKLVIDRDSYNKMMDELGIDGLANSTLLEREVMVPVGSIVFKNALSYSPGFSLESGKQRIIVLPDDEAESNVMFSTQVATYLSDLSVLKTSAVMLKAFGISKEQAQEKIKAIDIPQNSEIEVINADGELLIKLASTGSTVQQTTIDVADLAKALKAVMGEYIYGTEHDELSNITVEKAREINAKIAIAESGTDDALSHMFSSVDNVSDVLVFGVSATSDKIKTNALGVSESLIKKYTSSSEEVAIAMAYGAVRDNGADVSVAITGFVRGKKNTEHDVFIALYANGSVWVEHLNLENQNLDKAKSADYVCRYALDMIRRYLEGQPLVKERMLPLENGKDKSIVSVASASRLLYSGEKTEIPSKKQRKKKPLIVRILSAIFPNKNQNAKENIRRIILLLCIVVFLGSVGYIGYDFYQTYQTGVNVDKYADMYGDQNNTEIETEGSLPKEYLAKFASLYELNQDVKGWFEIEGTNIKYPVVQRQDDVNNDYYLRRSFTGENSKHGTLFIDFRNSVFDMSDNTIIYGHNINDDGLMFADLTKYKDIEFYKQHPIITFDTLVSEKKWKIVAAFMANIHDEQGEVFDYVQFTDASSEDEYLDFIYDAKVRSFINTGVDAVPSDKLLTLSTCTYEFTDARFVVVAREVREGEDLYEGVEQSYENENPLMPDIWYKTYGGEKPFVPKRSDIPVAEQVENDSSSSETQEEESSSSEEEESSSSEEEESSSSKEEESSSSSEESSSSKEEESSSSSEVSSSSEDVSSSQIISSSEQSSSEVSSSSEVISSSSQPSSSVVSSSSQTSSSSSTPQQQAPVSQTIRINFGGVVGEHNLVEVLSQIVANEMGNTFHPEALKAQAV